MKGKRVCVFVDLCVQCEGVFVCVCFGYSVESIPIAYNANTMWAFRLSHLSTVNIAKGQLPYSYNVFGCVLNRIALQ